MQRLSSLVLRTNCVSCTAPAAGAACPDSSLLQGSVKAQLAAYKVSLLDQALNFAAPRIRRARALTVPGCTYGAPRARLIAPHCSFHACRATAFVMPARSQGACRQGHTATHTKTQPLARIVPCVQESPRWDDVSLQPGRTQLVRQQDFARSSRRGDFTFAWRSRLFAWNYVRAVRVCLPPQQGHTLDTAQIIPLDCSISRFRGVGPAVWQPL